MLNLNLLFNKTYYQNLGDNAAFEQDCQNFNRKICDVRFNKDNDYVKHFLPEDKVQTVELVTTYPGMLVGTGYAHGTSISNDDVKIGFSFDYVTGQPYIPGSSVKGLLRSVFKEQPVATAEIIRACTAKECSTEKIKALEEAIFDFGDIFLDAVVCKGAAGGRLMGLDNITPHKEITKNPTPLLLLKILPGVHFEFRFILKDHELLTAAEKTEVFRTMLILFGAGAKTNVGYGQLVRPEDYVVPTVQTPPAQQASRNNGGGNNQNNNHSQSTQTQNSEKTICPHCHEKTWIRYLDGNPRRTCSRCGKKLF